MSATFTDNELAVLKMACESMRGNGFDFGFVDDCRPAGMTPKSAGAVLRGLRKKLQIWSDKEFGQLMADWKEARQPDLDATFEQWLEAIERPSTREQHKAAGLGVTWNRDNL